MKKHFFLPFFHRKLGNFLTPSPTFIFLNETKKQARRRKHVRLNF